MDGLTDGRTDGQCDYYMPPKFPWGVGGGGHKKGEFFAGSSYYWWLWLLSLDNAADLLLFIHCLLLHHLFVDEVFGPCFVVQYLVSFLGL